MKTKTLLPVLLLTAASLVFTGCGTSQSSASTEVNKVSASTDSASSAQQNKQNSTITVNIGVQQSLSALWIAKEKGWFEKAFAKVGVKVSGCSFQ
jgi:ABC-type nitrate/sulfonate/bicarbonate transport system substrate-binding protein